MKKILIAVLVIGLFVVSGFAYTQAGEKETKEIFLFSKENCIYCHHMIAHIDAKTRKDYPELKITILDIGEPENMALLKEYVKKNKVRERAIGTPITFIGKDYMMGWGEDMEDEFNSKIEAFLNAK